MYLSLPLTSTGHKPSHLLVWICVGLQWLTWTFWCCKTSRGGRTSATPNFREHSKVELTGSWSDHRSLHRSCPELSLCLTILAISLLACSHSVVVKWLVRDDFTIRKIGNQKISIFDCCWHFFLRTHNPRATSRVICIETRGWMIWTCARLRFWAETVQYFPKLVPGAHQVTRHFSLLSILAPTVWYPSHVIQHMILLQNPKNILKELIWK